MNTYKDYPTLPRTGLRRHSTGVRFAAAFFLAGFGVGALVLSYGWTAAGLQPAAHRTVIYVLAAALFVAAAANIAFVYWRITKARSASP